VAKKKDGRNKIGCKSYKDTNRREKNKVLRLRRHLKKQNDPAAEKHIERISAVIKGVKAPANSN
jgi:hypothetical protein